MIASQKILIVDDKIENLEALEAILDELDVEIIRALSGNEAVGLALKHDFALMLIDVRMPKIDGYETVEYIQKKEKNRDIPIIFVSAEYKDDFHMIKGIRSGAVDFITKPIVEDILVGKVRLFLELHQRRLKALRESKQNFQLLGETINEGFAALDNKNFIKFTNTKFCEITGYSQEDITGRKVTDFINEQNHNIFHDYINNNYSNSVRCEIVNKDTNKIPVLVSAKRLSEKSNGFSGPFIIFSEITELEKLQKEVVHISEKERQKFSHDLHDGLGQHLTGIAYMLEALKLSMAEKSYPEVKDIKIIAEQIDSAIDQMHHIVKGLCPVSIKRNDLVSAVMIMAENVEKIFSVQCIIKQEGTLPIEDSNIANQLFYIIQEAVNNALKHAGPDKITIEIISKSSESSIVIQNDINTRKDRQSFKTGLGIKIMKHRAMMIGADLEVNNIDKEFTVSVSLSF